jgi:transposase-like protein
MDKYSGEFKTIDTQEKAYVLGLFYADGYIYKRKYSYFSGITLHLKDEYLIDKLCEIFSFFQKTFDKSKPSTIHLRCNVKEFILDLKANGMHKRKSFENKENLHVPNIDKSLINHFIRGFFDGDGSVYFSKTASINSKYCTFTGVCFSFLKEIQEILKTNNINFRFTINKLSKKESYIFGRKINNPQDVGILTLSLRKEIEFFSNFLYKNSNIHLYRKYEIMNSWTETLSERFICRICNSKNTIFVGKNKYKCKNCNKIIPIIGNFFVKKTSKPCKHCNSLNTVGNGKTKSRTTNEIISEKFLCRNCNKNSSYLMTGLNNSNVINGEDELTGKLRDERLLCQSAAKPSETEGSETT